MKKEEINAITNILKNELVPALGCTEPIAIAYAASILRETLGEYPESVCIEASGSIIKNVKSVIVPNTDGLSGIEAAIAIGVVAGKSVKKLECIASATAEEKKKAREYMKKAQFEVKALESPLSFDLIIRGTFKGELAIVRISKEHTNVVFVKKGDKVLVDKPVSFAVENKLDKSILSLNTIWEYVNCVDIEDIKPTLLRQIEYNMAIAEEGMNKDYGANIGRIMRECGDANSPRIKAASLAAAGSDARMSGSPLPVIINSGSGNQGLTTSLPVVVWAEEYKSSIDDKLRALALSNLISIYVKKDIGTLSAFCGAVTAASGAGAGIAYLSSIHKKIESREEMKKVGSKTYDAVINTTCNTLAIVSGILCDGAKASCAAKIAESVNAAMLAYDMHTYGKSFHAGEGLICEKAEDTIRAIAEVGREGMRETNEEIIRLMTK